MKDYDPLNEGRTSVLDDRASGAVWADWCESDGAFARHGTRMKEHSRRPEGIKWCFRCRKRVEFDRIVTVPDGLSYYGPNIAIECTNCKADDGDLFPGWVREWKED